jgi:hypothetical protein
MSGITEAQVKAVYDALMSHAKSLGVFENSTDHEPLNAPGRGISFALIEGRLGPAPSGLAATSVTWEWMLRLYSPWVQRPVSGIDPKLTAATITVLASYATDLDLTKFGAPAGLVREVDVLGPVSEPKWMEQDSKEFRVREIGLAVILNDVFTQGA